MNRYHIRIDGEQSTNFYTYQELVDMGLFELDEDSLNGIEVKKITNPHFTPLKSFCFPERQSNNGSYYTDEYGQIHRKISQNNGQHGAYVDEYGQIIRPNSPSHRTSSSSTSASSGSSSTSTYNHSSGSDGWTIFWRIIGTIIVIGLVIAISAGTNGYGTPIAVGGYYALKAIWNE